MMSKILLIRHGQASFGEQNYDCLSPLGEQQAQYLGQHLATLNLNVDRVISGNMKRHLQTRDGVLSAMNSECNNAHIRESNVSLGQQTDEQAMRIDDAWNEFDFRQILGMFNADFFQHEKLTAFLKQQPNPEAAFIRVFAQAIDNWIKGDVKHDDGETWLQFQTRVLQGLQRAVSETAKGETTVIFTSGGAITVVLLSLLHIPLDHFLNINKELVNCGVTQLRIGKQGAVVLSMNEHDAMIRASREHNNNFVSFK